jgi:hypothetical protein
MPTATESTTKTCQQCQERSAAFDTGNGYLMCEPCAKRDGLVSRGELKAALDMLELAGSYARQCGATQDEVRRVVEGGPTYLETYGREGVEDRDSFHGEPEEWQRGYVALDGGEV